MTDQDQNAISYCQFQGFCCLSEIVPDVTSFQKHFQALDADIVVASHPKAGTTWLKALVFSIVNRSRYTLSSSPLNSTNPHDLVPYFELVLYAKGQIPDLPPLPSSRLFSTRLPYSALAESIKQSNTKIIYVTRNPLDVIVSCWHHLIRGVPEHADLSLEECFEMFYRGEEFYGPFWDHVLGYWKESLDKPNKVLFLRYEDLKVDPTLQIKKIAEFIGCSFSVEEERAGVIEEIAKFCSFSNLKNLEVNKTGMIESATIPPKILFRKGDVGDHINYLTPSATNVLLKFLKKNLVDLVWDSISLPHNCYRLHNKSWQLKVIITMIVSTVTTVFFFAKAIRISVVRFAILGGSVLYFGTEGRSYKKDCFGDMGFKCFTYPTKKTKDSLPNGFY